jgi:outer membrane protein assembly factor BamB
VLDGSTAYVLASDGKLHAVNLANGEDRMPPTQFTPAFAKPWSLNLVNDVIYTATSQGCNGNRSTVYSMDLKSPAHTVKSFVVAPTGGGGIWGRGGPVISADGEIYVETGDGKFDPAAGKYSNSFVGISSRDLTLVDYYSPENQAWIDKKDLDMGNMSPILFPFQNWTLVAGAGKEGVIYLLDAKKLGGDDHRTPLYRSPLFANTGQNFQAHGFWGAMATFESADKSRWLFAPALGPPSEKIQFPKSYGAAPNGSMMAFKVEFKDNKPVLTPAWVSRDMAEPEPPTVANGIVFALESGDNATQVDSGGRILTSAERYTTPKGNATLHALDAETGKELYSSGSVMKSFTHFGAPVISGGRVYVSTYDGTIYAFGLGQ